ncbi:MAG: C4-dicarboxylate ABC transporter substrate-binding protein [Candidatus Aminicenantes bacterium]|nr:C4-dicarboxylate ABC transporter substrate-binding protein [Candidatus Aminicenantes bacterium]NIM77650.1 C4-dicarboxylate ABC transporter substrate-binding protein [Candidatus Aminicenantes bacterium]NIN16962.1 C4-dicarboxylate ABC transporter substrate-binding protein [Candidatus Aminicenantes bacterium]NIN40855.1 C4-dicarboxylate ABC transporter substrate-binding protein [Candidatus Aminicenantes bacterium]NIN83659.1 C4-dicarboxylate ABC transporter substrate-binding protein [Candidatus A
MKRLKIIFLSLFVLAIAAPSLQAVTIKLGTIAPERSPWVKELKLLGLEWRKITNGKVKIKIYAGGIAGSEEDMARKIRLGILGGAVFTNRGINNIYPDSYVLNIPFYMDSIEELDYILEKMSPFFEKEIEKKGFKVIVWAKAGWVNFFTKKPIQYPEDLKKHKISFTTGAPAMEQAWKQSGYHIVPNELKDMMMGLQSGMVDSFYLPPIMAASGQFFPLAPNMCPLKIAPLMGGFVISKRIWDRIPNQYKEEMTAVAKKMAAKLYQKTIELEKEAIEEMKKHGLKINPVPPGALAKWKAASEKGMDALVGKAFSKEIFDKLVRHLKEFRQSNK